MLSFKEFIKQTGINESLLGKAISAASKFVRNTNPQQAVKSTTSVPSVTPAKSAAPAAVKNTPAAPQPAPRTPNYSEIEKATAGSKPYGYFETGGGETKRGRPPSVYSFNQGGTTTGFRTPSDAKPGTAPFLQKASGRTVFMDPKEANKMQVHLNKEIPTRFEPNPNKPGTARVVHTSDYGPLKAGSPVRGSEEISFSTRPALGQHPIEINDPNHYRGVHIGSKISHIGKMNYPD